MLDAEPRRQKRKLEDPSQLDIDSAILNGNSKAPGLEASRSVVASQRVDALKNLCEKHELIVGCSGKRGGRIRKDYVEAILLFVSRVTIVRLPALTCHDRNKTLHIQPQP